MLAEAEATPKRWWPQAWPAASAGRGFRSGTFSCARPGSASYSPRMAITGLPEPTVAMKAVGIPATPRSTRNPAASSESASSAAERRLVIPNLGPFPDLPGLLPGGVSPRMDRFIERAVLCRRDAGVERTVSVATKQVKNFIEFWTSSTERRERKYKGDDTLTAQERNDCLQRALRFG